MALLTVVVPTHDEAGRIGHSAERWRAHELFEALPVIFVDDGSSDGTVAALDDLFGTMPGVTVVTCRRHRSKLAAIDRVLRQVTTPFVLCLDADTWFEGDPALLLQECRRMTAEGLDILAFRLDPVLDRPSLVGSLQRIEYALMTDTVRRLFHLVGNINGAVSLWRAATLRAVLARHTLLFEGDDLEATLLARDLGASISESTLCFRKQAKPTLAALARQRALVWDVGLFRVLCQLPRMRLGRSNDAFFIRCYALFEGVLHPFKMLSFIFFGLALAHLGFRGRNPDFLVGGLRVLYALAAVASLVLLAWHWRSMDRPWRLLLLVTGLFLYPTFLFWSGVSAATVAGYYVSWVLLSAAVASGIRDAGIARTAVILALITPLYFLALLVLSRSVGMLVWLWRCVVGGWSHPLEEELADGGDGFDERWRPTATPCSHAAGLVGLELTPEKACALLHED